MQKSVSTENNVTTDSYYCPICANLLLTHLHQGKSSWYCVHCHQEMSYSVSQNGVNTHISWVEINENQEKIYHPTSTASTLVTSPTVDNMEILKSYVAYFLIRGKSIISPVFGKIGYDGLTYQFRSYHQNFNDFWSLLQERRDFLDLYLEKDNYNFGELLSSDIAIVECSLCTIPKAIPCNPAGHVLGCDMCKTDELNHAHVCLKAKLKNDSIRVLALGEIPNIDERLQAYYLGNKLELIFVAGPEDVTVDIVAQNIDLVLIHAIVSHQQGKVWEEKLHRHPQLQNVPIVALHPIAGGFLPWLVRTLEVNDYLFGPLNGEYLVERLINLAQDKNRIEEKETVNASNICWFPR